MPDRLLRGHQVFKKHYFAVKPYLQRLAREGQAPEALYIGCADSRVVPELLTNAGPGELFVVRNVANFVPPRENADASVGAAIEYALGPLGVRHVIVCGHTGCGGVKAALEGTAALPESMPELRQWIGYLEPGVREARESGLEGDARVRRAVEANVLRSLENLLTFEAVHRKLEASELRLHGWIYDMHGISLSVYDADAEAFVDAAPLVE
jgi:carbonic anhydrase